MEHPFEALLFDMDGLLLDTERLFMESLVSLTRPLAMDEAVVRRFFLSLIGTSSAETKQAIKTFLPETVHLETFDTEWRDHHRAELRKGVPLRPGVAEAIPALAGRGVPMAVVTSSRREAAEHHLGLAGLLDHFHLIVAGDEVSANKPDPTPYLQAASRLGADPTRCAAFEDSDTGTRAAIAAGCLTTQIPDLRPDVPLPQIGQRIAPDLTTALSDLNILPRKVA